MKSTEKRSADKRSPINLQTIRSKLLVLTRLGLANTHNRIVTCGLLVILFYLPNWLGMLWELTLSGSSTILLNMGFIYLGLNALWKQRRPLSAYSADEIDRLLGYLLILGGVSCFPFFLSSISMQTALCILILVGIAISTWGTPFFKKNFLTTVLLLISVYPNLLFLGNTFRRTLTGNQLESAMAWIGSRSFQAVGQPAIAQGSLLALSTQIQANKTVEIASGCSGFDMAFILAGVGLILGLFFKKSKLKTLGLVVAGIALALVFNVPRIMLVSYAIVYWGKESFEFWHGPIGGQIFASIMLTVYYYLAMAMIDHKANSKKSA